jgi:hypothetical protein
MQKTGTVGVSELYKKYVTREGIVEAVIGKHTCNHYV